MQKRFKHMAWHFPVLVSLWSGAILAIFLSDCWHIVQTTEENAMIEARSYLKKDRALRVWAASHGGVYVLVSSSTQPNPFLRGVPERDIRTPSGRLLTLMNPAYMIRQIMSEFEQDFKVRGHITSLRHYRQETAPDAWEKTALSAFENGTREVCAFTDIHGEPYLRIMRPLIAKEACLKCHASQGYKAGDIRGGVSLALPMAPFLDYRRREIVAHGLSFGIIWLLGGAGFWLIASKLGRLMNRHAAVEEELRTSQAQLKHLMSDFVRHQESERKAIALEIHEEIAQSLSAIKMSLEASLASHADMPGDESRALVAIIEQIKTDIDLIRRLTKRLSPIMLYDLGFNTAMATLCREISKDGVGKIKLDIGVSESAISGELKIAIYRVLEDMLTLEIEYCPASCRTVALNECDDKIVLSVQMLDPGGLCREKKSVWERKMTAAKNRAALFGGVLAVKYGQQHESIITVQWRLHDDAQA
jgi:signal transduction histidine kinase